MKKITLLVGAALVCSTVNADSFATLCTATTGKSLQCAAGEILQGFI